MANTTSVVLVTPSNTAGKLATNNSAFEQAIERHLDNLPAAEKRAFSDASQSMTDANLLDKVKSYDQEHETQSHVRPQTESMTRFLGVFNRFVRGVAIGIQANPDISSIIVGAVRVVIDLAVNFVGFFTKLSEMLVQLSDFLGPSAEYAVSSSGDQLIQESLINTYVNLLTFCRRARAVFVDEKSVRRKLTSWRVFWRLQWIPFEEEFGKIAADMKDHLNVLEHAAQAEGLNVSLEALRGERERKLSNQVSERENFLMWLSSTPFEETHKNIFARKHPGTGGWLLQTSEFRDWFDSRQSTMLWCHGNSGAGKSVLASNVIEYTTCERALDETVGIAFAYYNYQSRELSELSRVLAALVKQLCLKKGHIPEGFLNTKRDAMPPSQLGDRESFATAAGQFEEVFLVIDALDKCDKTVRNEMLRFLREIVDDSRLLVKVFVTSRREADIENEFKRLNRPTIIVGARSVVADIERYVTDEVKRLREGRDEKRLYVKGNELELKIIETLTEKADGIFLWVNLQLMNLCEVSESRRDREIERALETLPTGLDATYICNLRQIDKQKDYMRRLAFRTLQWVMYAHRTLSVSELRQALAAEEALTTQEDEKLDDTETILGACAHLLVEDRSSYPPTIRPVHYSVQEFFSTSSNSAFKGQHLNTFRNLDKIHARLAETCISYLQTKLLGESPCAECFQLENRIMTHPFLWYAAYAFDEHLACCTNPSKDLIRSMIVFLEQPGSFLASVLQLKAVLSYSNSPQNPDIYQSFESYKGAVDKRIMVYSTKLYDVPDLENSWRDLELPPAALHQACSAGLTAAVSRLVAGLVDINEKDDSGLTAVYYAAISGDTAITTILLRNAANVNAQGGTYGNALQAALARGHGAIVRLLLEKGADFNVPGGKYGSALQAASAEGHEAIVRLFLDKGADVEAPGGLYGNALQAASARGHEAIARLLLEKGADVNAPGGYYGSALQAASARGDKAIVRLLLEKGADVKALGGFYGNALQAASARGDEAIVRLLLEKRADVKAPGGDYGNALQAASARGDKAIVRLLLEKGADVEAAGGYYGTALQAASAGGHEAIVQLLLEKGAESKVQKNLKLFG